jgi:hypothetical protein
MLRLVMAGVCALAMVSSVHPSMANAQTLMDYNRVDNPTVEAQSPPGAPEGWTPSSSGSALALWDTSTSVSPTHNLNLDDLDGNAAASWEATSFAVRSNERLAFQYYAAYFGIAGGNFIWQLEFFDSMGGSVGVASDAITGSMPGGGTSFQPRGGRVTVPSGAASATLSIRTETGATGLAYFDDLTVDGNLLLNARFESGTGSPAWPLDWFYGDMTSWTQLPLPTAPSGFSVVRIDDVGSNGTDWRSKAVSVADVAELSFGAMSRRTGMMGEAQIVLRFGDGVDANGNLQNPMGDDLQVIVLSGDTVGFEAYAMSGVTVPAGATHADLLLTTQNDPDTTGTLEFDDAFVVPTEFVPRPGDLDNDGVLDSADVGVLVSCLGGPDVPPTCGEPYASRADMDGPDGDVDLADYGKLMEAVVTFIPRNVLINPSFELDRGDGQFPLDWFISSEVSGQCQWYDAVEADSNGVPNAFDFVTDGTHSIVIDDQSSTNFETTEWRSHGVFLPQGTQTVQVDWDWRYEDVDGDFFMTLAFFTDVDEFGNATGVFIDQGVFISNQGTSNGWEHISVQIPVPANPYGAELPVVFDLRFRAWGRNGVPGDDATGLMYIDDASVIAIP